ncbi:hypothetical protein D3C84_596170 [compost metagenome]
MQIDDFAVGVQADIDRRMLRIETPQPRHQPKGGEGGGGGDRQVRAIALRAQGVEALRHVEKSTVQAVEKSLAAVGQAYPAGQTLEQRHAEPGLQ